MASVIKIGNELGFPKFSNDGMFLKILHVDDILESLGSPNDDYKNFFTARLLLLLESRPLTNQSIYYICAEKILESYFRDYHRHQNGFKPIFLINDIVRFWKTLCLNYENKRNQPSSEPDKKTKQKIKNFKLKFSRMATCFSSVGYLLSMDEEINKDSLMKMLMMTPNNRLRSIAENSTNSIEHVNIALEKYHWFLQITNKSELELFEYFSSKDNREYSFNQANEFGDAFYKILTSLNRSGELVRYLVI